MLVSSLNFQREGCHCSLITLQQVVHDRVRYIQSMEEILSHICDTKYIFITYILIYNVIYSEYRHNV